MPNGAKQIVGTSVTLPSVSRRDSGNYICSADNGFGDPATALIQLDVQREFYMKILIRLYLRLFLDIC